MALDLIDTHPELCVTAGELRAAGYELPEEIPDCAWAPRASMKTEFGEVETVGDPARRELRIRGTVTFSAGLKWVEVKGTVTA